MDIEQDIKIAVDAIVFGYANRRLNVLLVRQKYGALKGRWALVGGFVKDGEGLHDAVNRELKEETDIKVNYLEQLYTLGDDVERDPRFRVVSVAYFALINSAKMKLKAGTDAEEARWFVLEDLPDLAFDHGKIIETALKRLRAKLTYRPVGFDLLPKEFPFSDLEHLYNEILRKEIDRRNFRKKMMSLGIVEETEKFDKRKSGRPAKLYRFNNMKYKELSTKGFLFEIKFV